MRMVLILTIVTVVYIIIGIGVSVLYYLGKKVKDKDYYFDPDVDTDEMLAVTFLWPILILIAFIVFIPKYVFNTIFSWIFTALNESYKTVTEEEENEN